MAILELWEARQADALSACGAAPNLGRGGGEATATTSPSQLPSSTLSPPLWPLYHSSASFHNSWAGWDCITIYIRDSWDWSPIIHPPPLISSFTLAITLQCTVSHSHMVCILPHEHKSTFSLKMTIFQLLESSILPKHTFLVNTVRV